VKGTHIDEIRGSAGEPSKAIRAARNARQAFKEALKKRKEFVFSASE